MNNQHFIVRQRNYSSINIIQITGDTTYSPPDNLLYAKIVCVGGGGGGGSGRVSGVACTGGQTGQAGLIMSNILYKSELTATTYNIVIGAGGSGGAAVSDVAATNGNRGTDGGNTTFGTVSTPEYIKALGGKSGLEGTTVGNSGLIQNFIYNCTPNIIGLGIQSLFVFQTGQGAGAQGSAGFNNGGTGRGGNGAGKSLTTAFAGGDGGTGYDKDYVLSIAPSGGTASTGVAGENGFDNVSLQIIDQYPISGVTALNTLGIGTSGAGGGSSITVGVPGGDGGNGGLYGTAGGGGGAGWIGVAPDGSGKGGDGSQGLCIIVEYLK